MANEFKTYAELLDVAGQYDDRDYRRGYQQGYSQAMDDLQTLHQKSGFAAAWKALCIFFDGPLNDWRSFKGEDDCNAMTPPPSAGAGR